MSFVELAVEGVEVEEEYSRRTSCTSTPSSSFQHIQSRLLRPFPAATTVNFLQANQSSSQHIHRSREAAHTDFVVNLADEGEELELEGESCIGTPLSTFKQHLIRSCSVVPATSSIFHPSQYFVQPINNDRNHFNAAENLVIKLGDEREKADSSSSAPLNSSFQLIQQRIIRPSPATQPALISLLDQSSQCPLEHTVSHFKAHDGTLKKSGTLNVVQKLEGGRRGLELETAMDEINCSTPLSSFQLIQSRLIRSSPSTLAPTIDLHQTNQSSASHHLAPLSVFQDCLKQMQSVRSIVRGDVCRRKLFSKSIDLDEAATLPVPKAAKRARIEDYVDTFLLSEAAQKIRFSCYKQELLHSNSLQLESNLVRGSSNFDWPSAELQAMTTSIPTDYYWSTTEQQLLTNDDLQIKQYPDVCHKSRRALFQQDIKKQNQTFLTKGMNSQFSSCGWAISGYDHDCDRAHHSHHSSSPSKAQYDANVEGFTLSPCTPPDNFQSFDTTVSLFQPESIKNT